MIAGVTRHRDHGRHGVGRHVPVHPRIHWHRLVHHLGRFLAVHWLSAVALAVVVVLAAYKSWDYKRREPQREEDAREWRRREAVRNADRRESKDRWRHQRALERIREQEERRAAKEQARTDGTVARWGRLGRWRGRRAP